MEAMEACFWIVRDHLFENTSLEAPRTLRVVAHSTIQENREGVARVLVHVVLSAYIAWSYLSDPNSASCAGIFRFSEHGFHPHLLHPHPLQPAGWCPGRPRRIEASSFMLLEFQGSSPSAVGLGV